MSSVHDILLTLHVLGGFLGLITGTTAALLKKERGYHSTLGKYFTRSMYLVAFTGIPLSILANNLFVFALAIFTLNMVITGSRAFKGLSKPQRLAMSIFSIAGALTLLVLGVTALTIHGNLMGLVALTFGTLLTSMGIRDWRIYKGTIRPNPLNIHINQMGGALIASYTAFLSIGAFRIITNLGYDPSNWQALFWLLPTVIGSLLLTRANAKYLKKAV
ncbi:MAG: hypothetical protein HWD92_10850 [Flavobacteriia bacterium]|nr:hypothetical protein [Flavobacteriia bacterium]